MKTIQILITVPDGVEVKIGGTAGNGAAPSRPFVERPDPDYPDDPCPICGNDWKLIKGGYSKTKKNEDGTPKRFNAFYVCQTPNCEGRPGQAPVMEDLTGMPF